MPRPLSADAELRTAPRRRGRSVIVAIVAVVVAVVLLAIGWFAAGAFRSPEQIAAAASPPPPSKVTAAVVEGDLRDEINVQSTVRRERTQEVTIRSIGDAPVVTADPVEVGDQVAPGAVVLEVNGAPVFALPGRFPLYRDIRLGAAGRDVRQLQEGLQQAGLNVTVDGVLGPSTRAAVERLYRDAGYRAPSAGTEENESSDRRETTAGTSGGDASEDAEKRGEGPSEVVVEAQSFVTIQSTPSFLVARPAVGTTGEDATKLTVTNGPLLAFASVTSSTAAGLTLHMQGTAMLPDGSKVAVTVSALSSPDEDRSVTATLTPMERPLPDDLLNTEILVTLTRQLAAERALIVPTRAVSPQGAGQQIVLRRNDDGSFSEVRVEEVAALGGRSAITVLDEGDLAEGDEVMVE